MKLILLIRDQQIVQKQVVAQYTDRIFDFKWIHHFAKKDETFPFNKQQKEYILWLDADDVF